MNIFAIRHKVSGKLMPLMRRGKGYSHWNPTILDKVNQEMDFPRFLKTEKQAKKIIDSWFNMPNAFIKYAQGGYYGDETDEYEDIKPDGRKKEDLEIVKFKLEEVK